MADLEARPNAPGRGRGAAPLPRDEQGVEANARLTGSTAAVLLIVLAIEGVTLLQIGPLLKVHVFVGMLLVPVVALKIGSTLYRFVRYYAGAPAYRRKGPPPALLRLLGPFVVVLTVILLATGIALLVVPLADRSTLDFLHKASFVLWFGAMALHVLGHILDTARLAPRDWYGRSRRQVHNAGMRQWLLVASIALGCVLGAAMLGSVPTFFPH